MYRDRDGVATKQSQAAYDSRIQLLSHTTCLLSFIGFGAAILNGDYTKENLQLTTSIDTSNLLRYTKLLWPLLSFHSLGIYWTDNPVGIYVAGLRGSVLSVLIVTGKLLTSGSSNDVSYFGISLGSVQLIAAVALSLNQVLFPRRPDVFTSEGKLVDLEDSASAFSRYSMHWCTSALVLAGKSVPIDELPALNYSTRSRSQASLLMGTVDTTIWYRLLTERYLGFAKQWFLMFMRSIVTFGSPYCVMRLLESLEDNHGRADGAWIWLIGIGVSSLSQTILNHQLIWIQWSEMGVPVRAQLVMTIFQKAMRRKDSKEQKKSTNDKTSSTKPEAINIITSDTTSLSKFTAVNYMIPAAFVRFFFAILFLVRLLGWKITLVSLIVTVCCVPVYISLIKQQRFAQISLTTARDKKTKAVTEALHALRQIKFASSEVQWEEYIETFRQEELRLLRRSFAANNIRSVWGVAAPFFVAAASVCAYAYIEGSLSPSIIFPMIEILPHLQGTLGFVPVVFLDYFGARTTASRIDEYLRRPEQKRILQPSSSGCVSFQDASIRWPSDEVDGDVAEEKSIKSSHRFSLHDINLEFPAAELSIISGKTGSGKSLLLAAIIGEAEIFSGSINAPSMAQGNPVAFVSQTPWLQNISIRENILFGKSFDETRYEKVLTACALRPDLAALEKGDDTMIGLRGVKLSGGQRARLSFARALYSDARLLILDDIFSALDSHVGKEIFNALTGELCLGRTRILVTHQVSLCLPKTKYIVLIEKDSIGYAGDPNVVNGAVKLVEIEKSLDSSPSSEENQSKPQAGDTKPKGRAAAKKSKKINARASPRVYEKYFAAAGGARFLVLYLLGLVLKQLLGALTTWLLGRIKSVRPKVIVDQSEKHTSFVPRSRFGLEQYLYLYLLCSLLSVVLESLFNLHSFSGSTRSSEILFREMTSRVIRMPLLWLDTTPIGDMLRRFTVQTRFVDDVLLITISEFADCLVKVAIVAAVGLYTSIWTGCLAVILLLGCAQVGRHYIKARSTVKRADVEPTYNILEHFSSSIAGISTIRAFGAVEQTLEQMHNHLDRLSLARRNFWLFNRWLGLQTSLLGILFSIGTGVILLSSRSIIDTSFLGFSLTFSMGFSQAIHKAVNNYGLLETYMDAAGGLIEYTELETEEQSGIDVPQEWPSKGKIELKRLNLAYSADLPLVLKDVSFMVGGRKRLGIVGRTGAGKSSLTLSLLRLIEPRSGSILIDDIDISTIKLSDLRTRIAFIPQDPVLFSGTVRSNLDYFNQISEDKLLEALRRVKLLAEEGDEKSSLFSLDSPISAGGSNMSQGQRQLLCLARIFLRNPSIMILDEATSAIDNKTDLLIQDAIRKEFTGTLIVVAHRLRTIAGFDQIMVMNDGRVGEIGKPDELLQARGMFYDLVEDSQDREFFYKN